MRAEPLVGVIMGSKSDWETMQAAAELLAQFGVPYEARVVSAHRTPEWMVEYATTAEGRGLQVIVAGAGGAAHLPGMVAGHTLLPVIGVPIQSRALNGLDSLLSIVQMPAGVPVATMAIGKAGAANAALLAVAIPTCARVCAVFVTNGRSKCWKRRWNERVFLTFCTRPAHPADPARRYDRRLRQRPVGAHDGPGGALDGLSHPHLFTRKPHPHGPGGRS
jgi:5-(carboxyamino)imidazole ribonucleotide mutase